MPALDIIADVLDQLYAAINYWMRRWRSAPRDEVDTRPGDFTEFKVILPRMAATGKAGADK